MSAKTIFVIIVSVLVTIILMKNTDEVNFWIFGEARVPKLAVLGVMFGLGLILGYMAGRPRKKTVINADSSDVPSSHEGKETRENDTARRNYLSDEDREYIN